MTEITVPFPDVPDFITSCYLQTELPAIVAKYARARSTAPALAGTLPRSTEYYSSGNQFSTASSAANTNTVGASSFEAQNFVALAPNDVRPHNSSLSYSGLSDYLGPDPLVQKASDLDARRRYRCAARLGLSASADAAVPSPRARLRFPPRRLPSPPRLALGTACSLAPCWCCLGVGVAYGIMDAGINYAVGDRSPPRSTARPRCHVGSVQPRGGLWRSADRHPLARDASKRWALKDVAHFAGGLDVRLWQEQARRPCRDLNLRGRRRQPDWPADARRGHLERRGGPTPATSTAAPAQGWNHVRHLRSWYLAGGVHRRQ